MIDKFLGLKGQIDEQLAKLQVLSDGHFNVHPDKINYSDIGDLERLLSELTLINERY